jgi:hypothetical protein
MYLIRHSDVVLSSQDEESRTVVSYNILVSNLLFVGRDVNVILPHGTNLRRGLFTSLRGVYPERKSKPSE